MAKAEWTRLAEADLEEVYLYIAREAQRPRVAKDVYRAILGHCDQYATLIAAGNLIGSDLSHVGPGLRCFTHQRWVILFRPLESTIRVLAVVDGSRDYGELFQQRADEE